MLDFYHNKVATNNAKLYAQNPITLLKEKKQSARFLNSRLQQTVSNLLTQKKSQLSNVARTLNVISPLQTLERGYSITLDNNGVPILSIKQINPGDTIETRLHNGRIISQVKSCDKTNQE